MRIFASFLIFFVVLAAPPAQAQTREVERYCRELLQELNIPTLWNDFRTVADVPGINCRKSWVEDRDGELLACGDPRIASRVTGEFEDFTDARLGNGSGLTLRGQAQLSSGRVIYSGLTAQEERINDKRKHVFVGAGLANNAKEVTLTFPNPVGQDTRMAYCAVGLGGQFAGAARVE